MMNLRGSRGGTSDAAAAAIDGESIPPDSWLTTESAVSMVESEAKELSEDEMLGAVLFGHQEMQVVIQAINELAAEAGKPAWDW